jgi:hypothetical protein
MPAFSIRKGPSELKVDRENSLGSIGVYHVYAFINPGEEGYAHLKVFEATKNISLDDHTVAHSNGSDIEYTGWSDNPEEKFFYSSYFSFDQISGCAVRFELWFKPSDTNKPERKLIEKIYSGIEGHYH